MTVPGVRRNRPKAVHDEGRRYRAVADNRISHLTRTAFKTRKDDVVARPAMRRSTGRHPRHSLRPHGPPRGRAAGDGRKNGAQHHVRSHSRAEELCQIYTTRSGGGMRGLKFQACDPRLFVFVSRCSSFHFALQASGDPHLRLCTTLDATWGRGDPWLNVDFDDDSPQTPPGVDFRVGGGDGFRLYGDGFLDKERI